MIMYPNHLPDIILLILNRFNLRMVKFQIKTFNSVYKYKIYICHKILYLPKIMSFAIEETGHN